MEGKISFKKETKKDLFLFIIKLSNGDSGKCWVVKGFRNDALWSGLEKGDHVDGLKWKDKDSGILDADSPISRI